MMAKTDRMAKNNEFDIVELHQRNAFLKIELANTIKQHFREIEELKYMNEVEKKDDSKKIITLQTTLSEVTKKHDEEQKKLWHLNRSLAQKMKLIEEDLGSAVKENENLQTSNKSLSQKLDNLAAQKEVTECRNKESFATHHSELHKVQSEFDSERLCRCEMEHELNKEKNKYKSLKSQLDELEGQLKIDVNSTKAETLRYKELYLSLEKESKLQSQNIQMQLEEERLLRLKVESALSRKEDDFRVKLEDLKHQHLKETQDLLNENNDLLAKLKEGHSLLVNDFMGSSSNNNESLRVKLDDMNEENLLLKERCDILSDCEGKLHKEKEKYHDLQTDFEGLALELHNCKGNEETLKKNYSKLEKSLTSKDNDIAILNSNLAEQITTQAKKLSDHKQVEEENSAELVCRIKQLEASITLRSNQYLKEEKKLKSKLTVYRKLIKKLRFHLDASKLREKDLIQKQDAFGEEFVSVQQHRTLQVKASRLKGKHEEFRAFVQGLIRAMQGVEEVNQFAESVNVIGQNFVELESLQQQALASIEELKSTD